MILFLYAIFLFTFLAVFYVPTLSLKSFTIDSVSKFPYIVLLSYFQYSNTIFKLILGKSYGLAFYMLVLSYFFATFMS